MRFYRALLRLYPASFRDEYGDDLCRSFNENTKGRTWGARIVAAVADVAPNAAMMRWEHLRRHASDGLTLRAAGNDLRFAFRQIARTPLFSGVVIAVIALGIGINAGLLTTLNRYAWLPAPGIPPDPSLVRLDAVVVARGEDDRPTRTALSYPDIVDLRAHRDVFNDVAAWRSTSLAADFGSGAVTVRATFATANYFQTLRVAMSEGVGIGDDDRMATPVAVIGHSLWMTHFGGSRSAIGKTIRVMNVPLTIVGVAPPLFTGVDVQSMGSPSIWIPLATHALLEPRSDGRRSSDTLSLKAFARLAPGVDARAVHLSAAERLDVRAERLAGMARGSSDTTETEVAFFMVVALVGLITCTNVSALLLGRAVARRREIGVRLSLGASRLRIVRQMLTESLVLAIAGALMGLLLYVVSIRIAYATIPEVIYGLQPEPATFLFAAFFALAATFAFGLAPALHASGAGVSAAMKDEGTTVRRSRLQSMFVVAQLACSQPVLVVTSLVLVGLGGANSRSDAVPNTVVTMELTLRGRAPLGDSSKTEARIAHAIADRATLADVRRRLEEMPDVESVALGLGEGETSFEAREGAHPSLRIRETRVAAGYFKALGIPVVRGRAIGDDEDLRSSTMVMVNQAAARKLWPGEDPLGKRLMRGAHEEESAAAVLEVIGVAGIAPYAEDDEQPMVFSPLANAADVPGATLVVRTTGMEANALVPRIRAAIRGVDPLATVDDARTLAELNAERRREARLSNLTAFVVGLAALLLASLGLYAVIAFAVAQRTREIGVRLAIGASPGRVVRQFCGDGLRVTAIGLAIGLPATIAGIRVVQASALGVTLQSVGAIFLIVPILIVVAALASWLPARRAGRVEPLVALRTE
jgi:predicted permease